MLCLADAEPLRKTNKKLRSARPLPWWPLKQRTRFDMQNRCQLVDHVDRCPVHASLQRTDISAIDLRLMGKRLLRQSLVVPSLPQIAGEDLSNLHARKATALSCISPRSILDNRQGAMILPMGRSKLRPAQRVFPCYETMPPATARETLWPLSKCVSLLPDHVPCSSPLGHSARRPPHGSTSARSARC